MPGDEEGKGTGSEVGLSLSSSTVNPEFTRQTMCFPGGPGAEMLYSHVAKMTMKVWWAFGKVLIKASTLSWWWKCESDASFPTKGFLRHFTNCTYSSFTWLEVTHSKILIFDMDSGNRELPEDIHIWKGKLHVRPIPTDYTKFLKQNSKSDIKSRNSSYYRWFFHINYL